MATTAAGTPYVEATDTASDYPTVSLALANRLDTVESVADGRLDAIEANSWVTTARINASAVTTAKIADDAVTPAKVSVPILSSCLYLTGASGNWATCPDAAGLDITGDIDIRCDVALADWTPAATQALVVKMDTGQISYGLSVITSGVMRFSYSTDGSTLVTVDSTTATGVTDGSRKRVRVTMDVNNGAGGKDIAFWLSDDGVTWTQLGTTVTSAGTVTLWSGTAALRVGRDDRGGFNAVGKFYSAEVRSGIGGTVAAAVDFRLPWDTRHRDSAGNTWTLAGSAWAYMIEEAA